MKTPNSHPPASTSVESVDFEGLRRLARRLVRDDADAEDLVQESLLLAIRRTPDRIRDFGSWIKNVMRLKAKEARRSDSRRRDNEASAQAPQSPADPMDVVARGEMQSQLVDATRAIPEPYRTAIWLRFIDGLPSTEIASRLGLSVETVRTREKRGVERLRRELDRRSGGDRKAWAFSMGALAGVHPSASLLGGSAAVVAGKTVGLVAAGVAAVTLSVMPFIEDDVRPVTGEPESVSGAVEAGGPRVPSRSSEPPTPGLGDRQDTGARGESPTIPTRRFRPEDATGTDGDEAPEPLGTVHEFAFHLKQGYSFASKRVVDDLDDADLVFDSSAGGMSSVTLTAQTGVLVPLSDWRKMVPDLRYPEALARAVVRVDPSRIVSADSIRADDRSPHSNAFLLKAPDGRWMSLAIAGRANGGDWTKQLVTIRYVFGTEGGVFSQGPGSETLDGVTVDLDTLKRLEQEIGSQAEGERDARLAPFLAKLSELDARAAALESTIRAREGDGVRVAAVLHRGFAAPMGRDESYVASTYSFEKATRDDRLATRNDWDFVFQTQGGLPAIRLNTVTDDRSRIRDLGVTGLGNATLGHAPAVSVAGHASPTVGSTYLIHTLDTDTDQWALLRVEEMTPEESMIFSWMIVEDASQLRALMIPPVNLLAAPVVHLQLRGGAGGGNPHRVYLDGSTCGYVNHLSTAPLDLRTPLEIKERHQAFAQGGYIPYGQVFIVDSIEYTAQVQGDSNGSGEFILHVGVFPVVDLTARRGASDTIEVWTLDGGLGRASKNENPFRGNLRVAIPIRAGEEKLVYAEIANSTWCDVTLSGHFTSESGAPVGITGITVRTLHHRFTTIAKAEDDEAAVRAAPMNDPPFAAALRSILEVIPSSAWRRRLELVEASLQR